MRTQWVNKAVYNFLLAGLTPANALVLNICERHGCRVGDVLNMRTSDLRTRRWSYREEKTGKRRIVTLSQSERAACLQIAGKIYVFEHRLDRTRHRTRQAVWKNIHKAAEYVGLKGVGTHTARKIYAVSLRDRGYSVSTIQQRLNHSDEFVTAIYAYADYYSQKINADLIRRLHLGSII